MATIIPIKNTVLCRKIPQKEEKKSILILDNRKIDEYEVLDFSSDEEFPFKVGDTVIVSSKGDEIESDKEIFYLFKTEHVIAKIVNN